MVLYNCFNLFKKGALRVKLSFSKKTVIPAVILSAVLFFAVILDVNSFFAEYFNYSILLYIFCLFASIIIGAVLSAKIEITNKKISAVVNTVIVLLSPAVTVTMTECLNNKFVYDMSNFAFAVNYILVLLLLMLVFAFSGSFKLPIIIVNPILFLLALINYYLKAFRGTPFVPMDFAATKTGMNVANEYNFTVSHQVMISILLLVFLIVLAVKIKTPKMNLRVKLISRIGSFIIVSVIILLYFFSNFFTKNFNMKPDFWNQSRGYRRYGFVYSFFINTKYLYITVPKGYDVDEVEQTVLKSAEEYDSENADEKGNENNENVTPNIICIMNESLADLRVLGDLKTNAEYMPFLNSLKENTVKGNLYVPVIGAGTSNTEYEFLTGNTTAFFPGGSNAYMLYVRENAPNITRTLNSRNYGNMAFHPYYASGWNRIEVYNNFGFSVFKSLGNILQPELLHIYQTGANAETMQNAINSMYGDKKQNMIIRNYISDSYNYEALIRYYKKRDKTKPFFAFNVTMQNHGGYAEGALNLKEDIHTIGLNAEHTKTDRYLSLLKHSDDAFKELIDYFSKAEEPVIICMFGDHQPSIEEEVVAELLGKDLNDVTVEDEQKRHITPFYIWANYDIKEENIEKMSANYLSSYLLKLAGVELTDYNKYLLELYKTLPVIYTVGYCDSNGKNFSWEDESEYSDILRKYEYIQYNNAFDEQNKKKNLFYLNN